MQRATLQGAHAVNIQLHVTKSRNKWMDDTRYNTVHGCVQGWDDTCMVDGNTNRDSIRDGDRVKKKLSKS